VGFLLIVVVVFLLFFGGIERSGEKRREEKKREEGAERKSRCSPALGLCVVVGGRENIRHVMARQIFA
jgi:hypothetical protein